MRNKLLRREKLTILYLKCPICAESSQISQWTTECFDMPTYQRLASQETQLTDDNCMICPKCLRSSMYGELREIQKYS